MADVCSATLLEGIKNGMRRRSFSFITVFMISFCSMVVHPISIFLFFLDAMKGEIHIFSYLSVAFVFSMSVHKTLRSLGDIDVLSLCKKCW